MHWDWDTQAYNMPTRVLARKAGQYGYERAQDLSRVVENGGLDAGEYEQFRRELSESSERGEYFYSVTSFVYHGRRA